MFELPPAPVDAPALRACLSRLGEPLTENELSGVDDAQLIEQIDLLERLKGAAAARQARLSVAFDESQRATQQSQGVRGSKLGRGVAEQIALARRESPTNGSRHLGFAKALVHEMPRTLATLSTGQLSEWAATQAVKETACLSADDRRQVDAELADRLPMSTPARLRRDAWAIACRLDPVAAANRHAKAVTERRVSVRPAPDAMTYLSALLPVKDGIACYVALNAAAASATASGDARSRGQVMADALTARVTGGAGVTAAGTTEATGPAVEVMLVVSDQTLLAGGDAPALVTDPSGSNPAGDLVPAPVARDLVRQAAKTWVRRLYCAPENGQLVAMESTRRTFDGNLRRLLVLRDQTCRTPWCDAPIRHGDHVVDHADGGLTSLANGQGLCERCNQTKNLPGWSATVLEFGRDSLGAGHVVRTTTPTGRSYDSTAPPLVGAALDAFLDASVCAVDGSHLSPAFAPPDRPAATPSALAAASPVVGASAVAREAASTVPRQADGERGRLGSAARLAG